MGGIGFMKKVIIALVLSLFLFLTSVCIFQLLELKTGILLIYPLASSIICTLLVYYMTSSAPLAFISLALNHLLLIFAMNPLSGGLLAYYDTLRFIFHGRDSYSLLNYLEIFTASSLAIGLLTLKICTFISKHRSREVYISDRTWKREHLS